MNFSKKNQQLKKRNSNVISKTLFTIAMALFLSIASHSQDQNIETESVTLDNFITFIVEQYSTDVDSTAKKNITFLLETYADRFNMEDTVILKQAFKLVSKRLNSDDLISFVTYSHVNGIVLNQAEATDVKKLLYAIEHPKSSIPSFEKDGIELAYKYAKEHFIEDSENAVVMIRMPNRKPEIAKTDVTNAKNITPKNNNTVVLTAIALLPEIIAIIKD